MKKFYLFVALLLSLTAIGYASHFHVYAYTDNNAVVSVPLSSNPNIAGVSLVSGDEIGAFSPGGLCVGRTTWNSHSNGYITVWGDDPYHDGVNGILLGETIQYKFWDKSANQEYAVSSVVYSTGNGVYQPNACFVISSWDCPLPIEMISQAANIIRNNDVELTWKTASETNNYGFAIERKRGNGTWNQIAFVSGNGTTVSEHTYNYLDAGLSFGLYSYRITQADLDGSKKTFAEMAVTVGAEVFTLTQNYPNPANPSTIIEFAVPQSGFATIEVYNTLGQKVATLFNGNVEAKNITSVRFDATNLPSGTYFYTLRSGNYIQTKRMQLVK
jgi:hypothetical protein